MIDIEEQLIEAGSRWRDAVPPVVVDWDQATETPRHRGRMLVAVAGVLGLVLVCVMVLLATTDAQDRSVRIEPGTTGGSRGLGTIDVSPAISQIGVLAVTDRSLWVSGYAPDMGPAALQEISLRTGEVIGTTTIPENAPGAIAVTGDAVWIRAQQNETSTALHKIDRSTHEIVGTVELHASGGLAVTRDAVWAVDAPDLLRIDPDTLKAVATIRLPGIVPGFNATAISAGALGVWLTSSDGTVWQLDETANTLQQVADLGDRAGESVQAGGSLWIRTTVPTDGQQVRPEHTFVEMSPNGDIRRQVDVGARILDVASDGQSLWVAADGVMRKVDPATGAVSPVAGASNRNVVAADPSTGEVWAGQSAELTPVSNDTRPSTRRSERVPVANGPGIRGYISSNALRPPDLTGMALQEGIDALRAFNRTLFPVTRKEDPASTVVGYLAPSFGFIDADVAEAPGFDIDTLIRLKQLQDVSAHDSD